MVGLAALLGHTAAWACGGLFGDGQATVAHAAERVVFAVDPEAGEVTTHVQVSYAGAAPDFVWVIPVPAVPQLFLSNDAVFSALANDAAPRTSLVSVTHGACRNRDGTDAPVEASPVEVLDAAIVGPYDAVVVAADDPAELVAWLRKRDYAVPDGVDALLAPYVAADQVFVALRLRAGAAVGDLAPIGLRYAGDRASVPIRLTAVAAVADLPIEVYVLGPSRAVPDNYLHVQLNQAAFDWYGGGGNLREVTSAAADEAGGQAFVTDFSGSTDAFRGRIWAPRLDLATLRTTPDPVAWRLVVAGVVPPSRQLQAVLDHFVPLPDGVTTEDLVQCPGCFDVEVDGWDPAQATDALAQGVLDPLAEAQAMVDGAAWLTRLSTTLDPAEMTLDPTFVFNPDVPQDVAAVRVAGNDIACDAFGDDGRRTLILDDGRTIGLPSADTLRRRGLTEADWLAPLASPSAIVVEDLDASGPGEVLFDYRAQAREDAAGHGCDHGGRGSALAALGLLAVLRRRRADTDVAVPRPVG